MGIGFFEILIVVIVAVLALKPEQLANTIKSLRRSLVKVREYTAILEQDIRTEEQERALQKRIEAASRVSDVSDLLPESKDESSKQP